MPRYLVHLTNTVGRSFEVEADTPDQAKEKIWETDEFQNAPLTLCHQCESNVGGLGDWDIADAPYDVELIDDTQPIRRRKDA